MLAGQTNSNLHGQVSYTGSQLGWQARRRKLVSVNYKDMIEKPCEQQVH